MNDPEQKYCCDECAEAEQRETDKPELVYCARCSSQPNVYVCYHTGPACKWPDPFTRVWTTAPVSVSHPCDRDVAEYFYLLGRRDGRAETVAADVEEMRRLVEVRLG
jgi:hypothetical protein